MKTKPEEYWKEKLTPEQYQVLRQKGTEPPFSGKLLNEKGTGDFVCAACGELLFKSDAKYDSKTPGLIGWPSFSDVANSEAVELVEDKSFGMQRSEVICKTCGSHLGHVFEAGDSSSGQHYCINSTCLAFEPKK